MIRAERFSRPCSYCGKIGRASRFSPYIGFVVHLPSLSGEMVWDDSFLARDSPFIKSPLFILEAFRHYLFLDSFSAHYRPVQNLSFIVDYFFWNGNTLWVSLDQSCSSTSRAVHAALLSSAGTLFSLSGVRRRQRQQFGSTRLAHFSSRFSGPCIRCTARPSITSPDALIASLLSLLPRLASVYPRGKSNRLPRSNALYSCLQRFSRTARSLFARNRLHLALLFFLLSPCFSINGLNRRGKIRSCAVIVSACRHLRRLATIACASLADRGPPQGWSAGARRSDVACAWGLRAAYGFSRQPPYGADGR